MCKAHKQLWLLCNLVKIRESTWRTYLLGASLQQELVTTKLNLNL